MRGEGTTEVTERQIVHRPNHKKVRAKVRKDLLTTYVLDGVDTETFKKIAEGAQMAEHRRSRAIILTKSPIPEEFVVRAIEGDQFYILRDWINRCILDALHVDFLADAKNITPARQKEAVKRWKAAQVGKLLAEEALQAAIELTYTTSVDVIKTHGRVPMVFDGNTWDPGYAGKRVFFIRRSQKGKRGGEKEVPA